MKLKLRLLEHKDFLFVKRIYQCPLIMSHIGPPLTATASERVFKGMHREMKSHKGFYYVIENTADEQLLGLTSLQWKPNKPYVVSGMIVLPAFQNQGICQWAQKNAMQLIPDMFPVQVCSVFINQKNLAAIKSYRNMGFNKNNQEASVEMVRLDYDLEQIINER